jgi:uncharacterized protein YyaL (SSP411 family)
MIAALARAGAAFDEPAWIRSAERAARRINDSLRSPDGWLLHSLFGDRADVPGLLDDYAFFSDAQLALFESTGNPEWLRGAREDAIRMTSRFTAEDGALYHTADEIPVLVRQKLWWEGALPSGMAVAVQVLFRLSHVTGDAELLDRAFQLTDAAQPLLEQIPSGLSAFLTGLMHAREASRQIVLVDGSRFDELKAVVDAAYVPDAVCFTVTDALRAELAELAPFTATMSCVGGQATAYVCRNMVCEQPITDPAELAAVLRTP